MPQARLFLRRGGPFFVKASCRGFAVLAKLREKLLGWKEQLCPSILWRKR